MFSSNFKRLRRPLRVAIVLLVAMIPLATFLGDRTPAAAPKDLKAKAPKAAPAKPKLKEGEGKPLSELLQRIPATTTQNVKKTFKVLNGFSLELVAHEPDVADPVDASFDADGRMYVAEMHGYPFSHEPTRLNPKGGGKKGAGIVRLLEDTNGDGKYDKSTVFADGLEWPTSVCVYDGGVFCLAPPNLYYLKDTNGDGVADLRKVVYTGFGRDNVQAVANNLKWTLDNNIAAAGASNPGEIRQGNDPKSPVVMSMGRSDFQFNPATEKIEPLTGGIQFGHSLDDWGNRFLASNSNHIQHVVFPYRYLKRNPYFAVSGAIRSIATDGAAAPVFRISPPEPWRVLRTARRVADPRYKGLPQSERVDAGFFTSAAGVTIYRGDAYPAEYRGNAFVGDVGGNLVHRKKLTYNGTQIIASRADEGAEIVASTDNWFRPANFVNAPDGTLFILDMYRETIEHPASIPEDLKKHLFLESGDTRGRIYRLVPPGLQRKVTPKMSKMSARELVARLESPNVWQRQTAQRLLWEQQDKTAIPLIQKLLRTSKSPLGRLHALYTLAGIGGLAPADVEVGLADTHEDVRAHAVLVAESLLDKHPQIVNWIAARANDPSDRVRFQVAFTLGETKSDDALRGLAALARNPKNDANIRAALMTSIGSSSGDLAVELLRDETFRGQRSGMALLAELARVTGSNPDLVQSRKLLGAVVDLAKQPSLQRSLLSAMGEGLERRGATIAAVLAGGKPDDEIAKKLDGLFKTAMATAKDDEKALPERVAAVQLLAFAEFQLVSRTLGDLLSPQTPRALQIAVVQSLAAQRGDGVSGVLLAGWRSYSPPVRKEVIDALTRSTQRLDALFAAVRGKKVLPGEIERDKKDVLLNHPNRTVRDAARKLFGSEATSDRANVIALYKPALEMKGDAARGKIVFEKKCATCHRVGEVGHNVGPDLASVRNKSADDMLISIMDPNRELQPNFTVYTLVTEKGTLLNGIIASETATSVTLRRAEGKEDVVLRSNIETLISNGKSLMPEGLEKEINPRDVADVIEFIRTIPAPPMKK